jgi:DNA-binding SARP family transcriptional activator
VGNRNPASVPWRRAAAAAAEATGDHPLAVRLLAEWVEMARRFGTPITLGTAMLARAEVADEAERLERLEEAERVLDPTPARLERARARMALGSVRAARGDHRGAVADLRRAIELAQRCGSLGLAQRASAELRALGSGRAVEAGSAFAAAELSPVERQVGELAAEGLGIRRIAEVLVLTAPEVEQVLAKVLRTLDRRAAGAGELGRPARIAPTTAASPLQHTEVRMLGGFEVLRDGSPVRLSDVPAAAVKLVALAGGSVHAEELIDRLWPDTPLDRGRDRLRTVLARVRTTAPGLLVRRGDAVALGEGVVVDVATFERCSDRALATSLEDPTALAPVVAAIDAYGGLLLPGDLYQPWAEEPRRALHQRYLRMLDVAARTAERHGAPSRALGWIERFLEEDPQAEDHRVWAAEILIRQGRRTAALAVLDRAAEAAAELGVPLGARAVSLRADLRAAP